MPGRLVGAGLSADCTSLNCLGRPRASARCVNGVLCVVPDYLRYIQNRNFLISSNLFHIHFLSIQTGKILMHVHYLHLYSIINSSYLKPLLSRSNIAYQYRIDSSLNSIYGTFCNHSNNSFCFGF